MSRYTTEVRFICETFAGLDESVGYNDVNRTIQAAIPKIFNFYFPIFDENYRNVLCTKILRHYYTREICEETVGLWQLRLENKLNEIMPYYNNLYEIEKNISGLFDNTNLTTKHTLDKAGETTGNNTSTGTSDSSTNSDNNVWDVFSDTPQGTLSNIENNTYLTNARKIETTDETTNETNTSANSEYKQNIISTDNYLEMITGKQGGETYAELLNRFKDNIISVDLMIIDELSSLFFNLW